MAFRREKKRIGDMLINENVITQEQLEKALPIAKEKHKKIGETLIELGFTNELEIAKALSQQLGLELVNVSAINIPEEVQNLVSETVLRKHVMIPYAFDKNNANVVHVAMADPMDMVALDDFSIVTNLQVEPAVATGRDILLTLDKYYGDTEAMKAAQEYARERKEREQKNAEAEEATSKDVNNSPVVLLVNSIIEQAARLRASDIHIEALENKVRVRYRIDGALDDFSIVTNLQVEPAVATGRDILLTLDKYYGDTEAMKAAQEYARERKEREQKNAEAEEATSKDVNNSPVVLLVNSIIEQAARLRASDIHIEALENKVRVRYRIDGALYEKAAYSIHLLSAIITRLKIIGGMDISEKRKPQDGRITMEIDKIEYDIRVSILPTVFGEKCVMRLAQKKALTRDKKELGFSDEELKAFDHILMNTNGIILVTGPTGSGKSTTLYTALSELNKEDVNIITVEDPVEANIDGINQVQVNNKADLTFASALRSILRQDPDIIMIGEIRDQETAQIAVQASITGHLVVSTLHTNSSASTISRLEDMGVESYLLADSVKGIIAQRLVRRLCPACKREHLLTEEEKAFMNIPAFRPVKIYEPCGCEKCANTGYKGRIGIYEIMTITPKIKSLISKGVDIEDINKAACDEGMHTLRQSAEKLVLEGVTSFQEMLKTTFEN